MPVELIILIVTSVISIVLHFTINSKTKSKDSNLELMKELESLKEDKQLNITIEATEKGKPQYDYVDKKVQLEEGNSLYHVATAFHELGHAMDDKNTKPKVYRWYHALVFYILKYSLPLSVVLYVVEKNMIEMNTVIVIITSISIVLSLIFAFFTLKEEIVATKYALKMLRERNLLKKEQLSTVYFSLFNGMQSYVIIALFAIMLLIFQLINYVLTI